MKHILIALMMSLYGCKAVFAPDIVELTGELDTELAILLEIMVGQAVCTSGSDCDVEEQMDRFEVDWVRSRTDTKRKYSVFWCAKDECPANVVLITGELESAASDILEQTITDRICTQVEKNGFQCNVAEQMDTLRIDYIQSQTDVEKQYNILWCLKDACPIES